MTIYAMLYHIFLVRVIILDNNFAEDKFMPPTNISEMIINGIMQGLHIAWPSLKPFVYTALASMIVFWLIKQIVYPLCIVEGYTPREAKKRVKLIQNLFDLGSALHDTFGKK